ncbi:MAG: aspartate/glutamate racemase family protein [Piscinibacter sp.]|nr:aspartate/glutamate racemase family protein [Piscinibacter sp.]
MLDTRFPRVPGDLGRADSFAAPLLQEVVAGAWPATVVASAESLRASTLRPALLQALRQLCERGASVLTTSCGFMVLLQQELQAAVPVPLASSALLLLPALLAQQQRVGVLTIDAGALGPAHLLAAGVPPARLGDVLVEGPQRDGEFAATILANRPQWDAARAAADVLGAARALRQRAPDLSSVVLECTNMPPYAAAIEASTGWRVLSLRDHPLLAPHMAERPA